MWALVYAGVAITVCAYILSRGRESRVDPNHALAAAIASAAVALMRKDLPMWCRGVLWAASLMVAMCQEYLKWADAKRSETALGKFLDFPESFVFGTATAAYQIEGAADIGGRGMSIWDLLGHFGMASGHVACDHYHRFKDDVKIMKQLGLKAYRFSISWSRLLPDGEGEVNEEGVRFYSDLIDALLAAGIEPWVTLYHWDLPLALKNNMSGWLGPKERVKEAFGAYCRLCFRLFGDRVKRWMTLNEPWCVAYSHIICPDTMMGWPSRKDGPDKDGYTAAHNLLLAHAEAVRILRTEFKAQGGKVGMALNTDWTHEYRTGDPEDIDAAQRGRDFQLGWFADPVYFGDYPKSMREAVGDRLPTFTSEEKELLKGSCDFFGVNCYFTAHAFKTPATTGEKILCKISDFLNWRENPAPEHNQYSIDRGIDTRNDPQWEKCDNNRPVVPWGFREALVYIHDRYKPEGGIFITENGCAREPPESKKLDKSPGALVPQPYNQATPPPEDFESETFDDPERTRYYRAHLCEVHAANAKGADVRGYFAWSFLDNFEWFEGYKTRFGMVRVDYKTQKRTIKGSGRFYARVIRDKGLNAPSASEKYNGTPW